MKHFNRHSLAILPLLSILAMSPRVIQSKATQRHVASVVEEVPVENGKPEVKDDKKEEKKEEFKKFKEYSAKVSPDSIVKNENLTLDDLKKQETDLKVKLDQIKIEAKKEDIKKEIVDQERKDREALVVDLLLIEDGLKGLDEKKAIEIADKEAIEKSILEHKVKIEELLLDLEQSEEILAKAEAEEPKKEEEVKPVLAEEPKKEEEVKPVVAEEPKKEEVKKEVCEADEKNALLTKQVEQLLNDQKQIMQTMLGMAQMMISMHQNQQQQQPNPYYANSMHANPYQYNQPFTSGNWVYYPNGFQPSQPNIFAQPQMQQQQGQQGGFYPSQSHQQSNWNLAPQYNFQADPRYTVQPIMPGSFGSEAFSYNLSNQGPANPVASANTSMNMNPGYGLY
ncbi:MAG: hypothetical protein NDI69_03090 [Bacteriovoracaceae bacterium]|nr:hypothetical protein [Bacteriovoracaceae bacterium]